jgi:hypothetical protein
LSAPRNVVVVGLAHERGVTTGWNELIERHNHRISVTISFPQKFFVSQSRYLFTTPASIIGLEMK